MGDWSDYFEDFPDENPANYANGKFDPQGAASERQRQARDEQVAKESAALRRQMHEMAARAKREAQARMGGQAKADSSGPMTEP